MRPFENSIDIFRVTHEPVHLALNAIVGDALERESPAQPFEEIVGGWYGDTAERIAVAGDAGIDELVQGNRIMRSKRLRVGRIGEQAVGKGQNGLGAQ